jgi:hypothetical protein
MPAETLAVDKEILNALRKPGFPLLQGFPTVCKHPYWPSENERVMSGKLRLGPS